LIPATNPIENKNNNHEKPEINIHAHTSVSPSSAMEYRPLSSLHTHKPKPPMSAEKFTESLIAKLTNKSPALGSNQEIIDESTTTSS
jgi:hypothetical protein